MSIVPLTPSQTCKLTMNNNRCLTIFERLAPISDGPPTQLHTTSKLTFRHIWYVSYDPLLSKHTLRHEGSTFKMQALSILLLAAGAASHMIMKSPRPTNLPPSLPRL